jgi:hypothetical protein
MNMRSKISYKWHLFWYRVNDRLYHKCIDPERRDKFYQKKEHHRLKALFC